MSIYKGTILVSGTMIDGSWVDSSTTIASNANIPTTAVASYSLATYLPNDSYIYEVLFSGNAMTASTTNSFVALNLYTDIITSNVELVRCNSRTVSGGALMGSGNIILPIGSARKIYVNYNSAYSGGTFNLRALGYRRIGTN